MISVRLDATAVADVLTLEVARVGDDDGAGLFESVESGGHGGCDGRG